MARRYFVYQPFQVDTADTRNLETAVERWKRNVLDWKTSYDHLTKTVIPTLTKQADDADAERWQRDDARARLQQHQQDVARIQKTLQKSPTLIRHLDAGEKLKQLSQHAPEAYVLYVVGHCAPGRTTLTETQSIRTAADPIDAKELVRRLVADGLPANVRNVKLLACFGGSANPNDSGQTAYAKQLWSALRTFCTGPVVLSSYTEAVLITSFYARTDGGTPSKTFAKVALGSVVDVNKVEVGGRLKDVRAVQFKSRECQVDGCTRPILYRCRACGLEHCVACNDTHVCR